MKCFGTLLTVAFFSAISLQAAGALAGEPSKGKAQKRSFNSTKASAAQMRPAGNAQTTQGNARLMKKPSSNHPMRKQGSVGNSQNVYSEKASGKKASGSIEKKVADTQAAIISKF